jgi:autotransporter-associated beta strand protein
MLFDHDRQLTITGRVSFLSKNPLTQKPLKARLFLAHSRHSLPESIRFGVICLTLLAASSAHAVDYYKANNTTNLNQNASWVDFSGAALGTTPVNGTGSSDLLIWDSRVVGANTTSMGDNIGVNTIRILDPGGAVAINGNSHTFTFTSSGGVDMSQATQDLTLGSGIFFRATGSVVLNQNVALGRQLKIDGTVTVRNNATGGTVNHIGAGKTIYNGTFAPTNVVVSAGEVQFNAAGGSTRLGTPSTTVNGGKLVVNNTSGSATGSGSVTINNTGTLTGQGIMSGLVTINSGATIIPAENTVGTLRAGSLTLAAGSSIHWEGVDPTDADLIEVSSANGLTINGGTISLFNEGTNTPFTGTGTFKIISYSGAISGGGVASLTVDEASKLPGYIYLFGLSEGFVTLTIGEDTRPKAFWNVDANGNWSTPTNWTGLVVPNAPTFVANLGGAQGTPITQPRTVTLNGSHTVGTLLIDSAQPFTVAGSSPLNFDDGSNAAILNVENGSHLISAPISMPPDGLLTGISAPSSTLTLRGEIAGYSGISKSGPGTLILGANNSYWGATSNGAGVLQIGEGGTVGSVAGTINNSGTLIFNRSNDLLLGFGNEISGAGSVTFAGSGVATLGTSNSFSGPTNISAGTLVIEHPLALQNSTLNYSMGGGQLIIADTTTSITLGALAGNRSFPLTNSLGDAVDLTLGQNNQSTIYSASTLGQGSNFTKTGSGSFSISGTHEFSGNATVNGGVFGLDAGAVFSANACNLGSVAGAKILVNGGTLNASSSSLFRNASAGLEVVAGTATFNGGIVSEVNISAGNFFTRVTGGTLNTSSLSISRGALSLTTEPATGQTGNGLYVNGGDVNISGTVVLGNGANSSVSARIDSGSLTVGGPLTVGLDNTGRWSVLDIGGGTFSSTNADIGVRLGTAFAGQVIMLVRGGVASAERVQFGQAELAGTAILNQTGGTLYLGAGGMVVGSANSSFNARLRLGGGVLGASADSTSNVPVSLTGNAVVTGADAFDTAHSVHFSGSVNGTGTHSLTKNGSGSVSFDSSNISFAGPVTVNSGTLGIGGQTGAVTVASAGKLVPHGVLSAQAASAIEGTLAIRYDVDALVAPGRIHAQGLLTLGAASVLEISGTGTLTASSYTLASGSSGVAGTFGTVIGVPDGYTLVYSHDNGSGSPVVALVAANTPYGLWASSFTLSGTSADPGADPDGDGISNLMEFALGRNPRLSDGPGPTVGRSGDFLTLTFNHIAGGNLTYAVQASDSLGAAWTTIHTYAPFNTAGTATYTDSVAIGNSPRRFLRLSVVMAN